MANPTAPRPAPEIEASHWFNTPGPITLGQMRGRVVVIEAFQMLCPGCVSTGLPQAARIAALFPREHVQVIGLHSVFEHHEAQGSPAALTAFIHEYRWPFPIALDARDGADRLPRTMLAYGLEGTPSLILIDRAGFIRHQHFGHVDDMAVGAQIMALVQQPPGEADGPILPGEAEGCSDDGCSDDGCAA